ncbi:MAG: PIN domain-containing protein [Pirellulales bacterium]|nr:PIN domain-containing protein [Pirellulales bacterium]
MIIPDSSLLLYAYNTTSPDCEAAKKWWEGCLSGTEMVGLCYPVLFSFMRVGTATTAFKAPFTLERVATEINHWLDASVTRLVAEGPDHFKLVVELLEQAGAVGGNLTTDAQIAAIASEYGATIHTVDRDFLRFKSVRTCFPLDEA